MKFNRLSMLEKPDVQTFEGSWKRLTERVEAQDWPIGALYVVATPIGNLADLSLRALHTLSLCDVIAAEDTRSSRQLLDAWGITTPLVAAHRHNEAQAGQAIIERLLAGQRVGLISDAGAPGVSDPGARIVRACQQAGCRVIPIPGASAVLAALMASGATSDENPAFVFAGFMPSKAMARRKWLQQWCVMPTPVVMFESPHRVRVALADVLEVCGPDRQVTIARELTKRFEQVVTMPLSDVGPWFAADSHHEQGEFVLIVHAAPQREVGVIDADTLALLDILLETVSVRDAVKVAARVSGLPRDTVYKLALERQPDAG